MRKYILFFAAFFITTLAFTQSNKEEVDLIQAAFGMDKKAIVADFVTLSDSQKDAFWQLYDEYESQRKELGKQRIELLQQYADQYLKMTSEQATAWTKKVIDQQKKTDHLIVTYFGKINNTTDGIVATQFYQIENYILTAVRMVILEEIPFVDKP